MKKLLYNNDNLEDSDITKIVKRAKILIINSNDEILLAYSDKNYQLIGGHVEDNETFEECIVREVKEETGIDLPLEERQPFYLITYFNKDYPSVGINSKFIANYYEVKTDIKTDLSKVNLTEEEKSGNFELRYIHKDKILQELENSLNTCNRINVVKDTINAVNEYLNRE